MPAAIKLVDDETHLAQLVNQAAKTKQALDLLQAEYDGLRGEIQDALVTKRYKAFDADQERYPGKIVRAVYSSNTRTTVNEEGLAKALGAKAFNKVVKKKVDMTLLNTAVLEGTVDEEVVAKFLVRTDHPNIRFYIGLDKKEEGLDGADGPDEDR